MENEQVCMSSDPWANSSSSANDLCTSFQKAVSTLSLVMRSLEHFLEARCIARRCGLRFLFLFDLLYTVALACRCACTCICWSSVQNGSLILPCRCRRSCPMDPGCANRHELPSLQYPRIQCLQFIVLSRSLTSFKVSSFPERVM